MSTDDEDRAHRLTGLANLLGFLSETTASTVAGTAYVGVTVDGSGSWADGSSGESVPFPTSFFDQSFMARGPCPITRLEVYSRLDLLPALAWLVAEGAITQPESDWLQNELFLRLIGAAECPQ